MDNFQKKFVEEATDLINTLERALLSLEKTPKDANLINEVFRVMHSLKGGGAMFGFEAISSFTHNLENIYDLIRNNQIQLNQDILSITFASVDLLRTLLDKSEQNINSVKKDVDMLTQNILSIIQLAKNGQDSSLTIANDEISLQPNNKFASKTYYIKFIPNDEIFANGTNPLYLLDEISSLGESFVIPNFSSIPSIDKLNYSKCFTQWTIFLATSLDRSAIHDVFIFVEDDSTIEIKTIAQENLFENEDFKAMLKLPISEIENKIRNTYTTLDITIQSEPQQYNEKEYKNIREHMKSFSKDNVISSVRVASDKLDALMNLVSELVTTQASLSLFVDKHKVNGILQIVENLENITRQLRDNAFSMSLIPFETVLTRFQRLVRDLSAEFKKDIVLRAEGTETELDKSLIQGLTDPLMHIIRNSIDHGIESVEERIALGKPKQGVILLKAFYSGASVQIIISDDGRGICPELIRRKAISKGIISPDNIFSDKDILDMVFLPGFSTASNVTDISGRGVGMDVVKRKVEEIRGEVDLRTIVGSGTTITIKLPLTLSIIDGLLVKIGETIFIIPLSVVNKIRAMEHSMLINKFNGLIVVDEEQIPFYNLREEFAITEEQPDLENVIIVNYDEHPVGLVVDMVVGEYQAVLKPLGRLYKNQDIFSGATILGDGSVALVLDTNKIISEFSSKSL